MHYSHFHHKLLIADIPPRTRKKYECPGQGWFVETHRGRYQNLPKLCIAVRRSLHASFSFPSLGSLQTPWYSPRRSFGISLLRRCMDVCLQKACRSHSSCEKCLPPCRRSCSIAVRRSMSFLFASE